MTGRLSFFWRHRVVVVEQLLSSSILKLWKQLGNESRFIRYNKSICNIIIIIVVIKTLLRFQTRDNEMLATK